MAVFASCRIRVIFDDRYGICATLFALLWGSDNLWITVLKTRRLLLM